jgi:phage gp46-like protein
MDVALVWDSASGRADWAITSGDLQIDPGGLQTAVILSLFTDKRAPANYVPPAGSPPGRHGVWMDTYQGFQIGSLLWTLNRVAISNSTAFLAQAKDICLDALEWLVTAGVVAAVNVTTSLITPTTLGILVGLTEPDGTTQTFDFGWAWQGV